MRGWVFMQPLKNSSYKFISGNLTIPCEPQPLVLTLDTARSKQEGAFANRCGRHQWHRLHQLQSLTPRCACSGQRNSHVPKQQASAHTSAWRMAWLSARNGSGYCENSSGSSEHSDHLVLVDLICRSSTAPAPVAGAIKIFY